MIIRTKLGRSIGILALMGALGVVSPARSDRLPSDVARSVVHWWRGEGRSGKPKTRVDLTSRAGRRFMQVTIDEADYRGATGNETSLLYLRERGRWRWVLTAIGLGFFVRRGGPDGRPWIETCAHDSAAVAAYELWGWDGRKRAYALRREWEGPYPEATRFVLPPGGLPGVTSRRTK